MSAPSTARCGALPLRIFIYGGRDDAELSRDPGDGGGPESEGARESWAVYPGGHSWNTWTPHVDQMLVMAQLRLQPPAALIGRRNKRSTGDASVRSLTGGK